MPNPKANGGTHELQERYAKNIVALMRPEMLIRNTFSRDYEGDPTSGAVKVPVRKDDVTVQDYDVVNGADLTTSKTEYLTILVDKFKAVNELIDGYEADAVPDNLIAQRLESAAFSLGSLYEADAIATLCKGTASQNADCTAQNVYSNICKDISKIKRKGVKKSQMRVAISNDTELLLLENEKYSNSASQIGAELAREGVVGKINGVYVICEELGNKEVVTGTGAEAVTSKYEIEYIVYATPWCQAIDEWSVLPAVKDLNDGKHIGASALQGRQVYTDALTDVNASIYKCKSTVVSA